MSIREKKDKVVRYLADISPLYNHGRECEDSNTWAACKSSHGSDRAGSMIQTNIYIYMVTND